MNDKMIKDKNNGRKDIITLLKNNVIESKKEADTLRMNQQIAEINRKQEEIAMGAEDELSKLMQTEKQKKTPHLLSKRQSLLFIENTDP
jgi:hypothetical protein